MYKASCRSALVAAIVLAVLMAARSAYAQVDGAVQYPPASAGKDAQPPPPAGMVPPVVSPRRYELGISGSGALPPADQARFRARMNDDPLGAEGSRSPQGSYTAGGY